MTIATILAVEDNLTHQYVVRRLCEMFEYDVHIVDTAEKALSAVAMTNYAAILMDLSLPGMDGLECAKKIREQEQARGAPPIPIVALTAANAVQDKNECFRAGMNDYLSKPFDPEDLRKVLLRWVYHPSRPNLKLLKNLDENAASALNSELYLWDESG